MGGPGGPEADQVQCPEGAERDVILPGLPQLNPASSGIDLLCLLPVSHPHSPKSGRGCWLILPPESALVVMVGEDEVNSVGVFLCNTGLPSQLPHLSCHFCCSRATVPLASGLED